ncbi:MAG: hypothetical protein ACRD0X_05730, partial [Thermoanaerobaculia bacterium]
GAETVSGFTAKLESELLAVGQTTSARLEDGTSSGPDVTVIYLTDVSHYTSGGAVDGKRAYSLGTTSCNVGDEPVAWCDNGGGCGFGMGDEDHPAIAQNLYRLKEGRFEQIGMSWLKHGFVSTNSFDSNCGSCQQPPAGGDQLGVGCTDAYGSGLNGSRPLGLRSEVNATTGLFPFPYTDMCDVVGCPTAIEQRIQVLQDDLDPALNPGALYYMEGQYVTGDDALEGNGLNNASHRRATVNGSTYVIGLTGPTVREQSALYAWQANDPGVEIVDVDVGNLSVGVPNQRFEAARRVLPIAGGAYHYEISIHNLNSDRSAGGLLVEFPQAAAIANLGFHDVDHHSGEPYSTADWTSAVTEGGSGVHWFTDAFAADPDANALRWGTTFTFRFDADRPPDGAAFLLELFKPGIPATVPIPFAGVTVFSDGFESGTTGAWDELSP